MAHKTCHDCKQKTADVKIRQSDYLLCNLCEEKRQDISGNAPQQKETTTTNWLSKSKRPTDAGLSLENASKVVTLTHQASIDGMNLQQLNAYNGENTRTLVQGTLASILPLDHDPAMIANSSISITNNLMKCVQARKATLSRDVTAPVSFADRLLQASPLRPRPTAVTAQSATVVCIEDCLFNHKTKGKPMDCCFCQAEFHPQCVGITAAGKRPVWVCSTCKAIPASLKSLQDKFSLLEKNQLHLKKRNDDLNETVATQAAQISDLTQQLADKCTSPNPPRNEHDNKKDEQNTQENTATTLLIGDSIIRDINAKGLENTKVECMRGKKARDIKQKLEQLPIKDFATVIIQASTNDCTSAEEQKVAEGIYAEIVDNLNARASDTAIGISTVCPRTDNVKYEENVTKLNDKLRSLATSKGCLLIDNDTNFRMQDNSVDTSTLDKRGLHLSTVGTKRLLNNIHKRHAIIKCKPDQKNTSPPKRRFSRASRNFDTRRNYRHNAGERFISTGSTNMRGCYLCGERNHQKKDCKFNKPLVCFSCGQLGHKQGQNMCRK